MFTMELLEYKEVLEDEALAVELKRGGNWIIAYVNPAMAWPARVQKVAYRGIDYWIIPISKGAWPAVAVREKSGSPQQLRENISRFLSVLSWIDGHGVSVETYGGGTHLTPYVGKGTRGSSICNKLDLRYLPEIADQKAMLALALVREGRGLRHPAYSFLSFWRVLEVAVGKNNIQTWINVALNRLDDNWVKEAVEKIRANGIEDLGNHFYVLGRCAIAHANDNPIIDPDQPEDAWRLSRECPIVEALAVLAVQEKLGIKTSRTIYREHLYELDGFKKIIGDELVEKIITRKEMPNDAKVDFPEIDFGLLDRVGFQSLKRLLITGLDVENGRAQVVLERTDGRLRLVFALNFDENRMDFDIYNGIYLSPDDGSSNFASIQADLKEFLKWYMLNGCLELRHSETGEQIARKDEFIPVNIIVQPEGFDNEIAQWKGEAVRRLNLARE